MGKRENSKNKKEILKTKLTKVVTKKRITVALILIILIATLVAIVNKNRKGTIFINQELARSMNYEEVKEKDKDIEGTDNVKFDAFFLRDLDGDGYAESIRGTCRQIGKEDTLYMELNVQTEGYLKDGKITINGENFYLQTTLPKDQELKENYIGKNIKKIEFNNLTNGTQKLITGIVRSGDYTYTSGKAQAIGNNVNNYSKVNSVTLTGTYVDENGNETPIIKQVDFNIDWHGKTASRIYTTNQNGNITNAINEEEGIVSLNFTVYTEETAQELILKSNHVEGEIPQLSGFDPIEVTYTGTNGAFNYDAETRKFTLDREAIVGEDGGVQKGLSRSNSYGIKVVYPLEAYRNLGTESVQLKIPVSTYYEGFNNPNTEFNNPYKSNISKSTILAYYYVPQVATYNTSFEIKVGKYIYEPSRRYIVSKQKPLRIYNGESEKEENDNYTVMWKGYVGTNASSSGMIMQEAENETDIFIKTNAENESAEDVVQNVGIYFSGASQMLGEDGWIKVYNKETGDLLKTFTKEEWNTYTSSNPYRYELAVKHIRVETSEIVKKEVSFYVYNIKEIDDEKITTKYEREQFDELQYIKSTLTGSISGDANITVRHTANYEAPVSVATINISQNTISTQSTAKNDKITITTKTSASNNQVEWQNGIFLVKFPTEVIDVKLNEISVNNKNINIESYEVIEENGQSFIKIVTKNNIPQTYEITLDVDISPDPRIATTTKSIELFASNENGSDYYYKAEDTYDVNNNLNKTELVNHTSVSLSMISPNSLLTNQTATNYDDKNSIVISPQIADVKPQYAVVDQEQINQTASIGTQIKNNYASTISDIKILGKIPFKGNTYVISGADLNSSFTTKMTNEGIIVPEELQEIAKVYYSENETPDINLSNETNNWKTVDQVENWDNIKTFLIDLGNYVMPTGKDFVFNYTVEIPKGIEFNQVSYSHHGVYFSLDTENGKYKTQTEPNKLGFRIAEKYDLELNKYQTGKEKLVPGATYSFREVLIDEQGQETAGETKTGLTNSEGILRLTNLYAEKIYEIKEIKSPEEYEINEDTIRFIGHVNKTTGELTVEKIKGNTRDEIAVTKNEGENYKITVNVEDEAKANLKITKVEQGTDVRVSKVKYKITGYGLPESGKTATTNVNGEINLKGLKVNEEYTLEEVKADGYYLASQIKFKIVNNEGNYEVELIEGTTKEIIIAEEDSIPTVNMTLEDEKIPTYDLEILKIQKKTNVNMTETEGETPDNTEETVYLAGAKFKLYKGTKELGEYITDENGRIEIQGLYQYVAEKADQEEAKYMLKEVLAPEGYAKVKDICFKVEEKDGALKFIEEVQEGQTTKQYIVEGNKVTVTVEDNPSFKLIKKDAETGELLANVKFAIYNIDEGEMAAKNSKGEILGTKETINGKEYYTVSTNEVGEITADLQEGLYKAVEVEAPDKYDIKNSTYYFGIGASREGKTNPQAEWAKGIGGSNNDQITTVIETNDGGYLAGGYFQSSTIDLGNGVVLSNNGSTSYTDGMLIKYDAEGNAEWVKGIGGSSNDQITTVIETSDGGYLAGGYFQSNTIDLGNGVVLKNNGSTSYSDGMVIKLDSSGEIEWAKGIGGSSNEEISTVIETKDGGYLAGGYFSSSIDLGNGVVLKSNGNRDGMLIKLDSSREVEWAKGIGGSSNEAIKSLTETRDRGYLAGGYFSSSIDLGNGVVLKNNGSIDGMLIKLDSRGKVEWAKGIGGIANDYMYSVIEMKDGGYLAGGRFSSSTIDLGNGVVLKSNGYMDGMLIKYDAEGNVEWGKVIGGSNSDYINSIIETSDGGYLAGGYFQSSTIDLGNGVVLKNNGSIDGMIIKYDTEGNAEWAKVIGGDKEDRITTVVETREGGYLAGGRFSSSTIDLGNGVVLKNNGSTAYFDGMVIKFNTAQVPEIVVKQGKVIGGSQSDEITTVIETRDGGYLVGGYFYSSSIDLGNGVVLNKNSNSIGHNDGILIKYDAEDNAEWARGIGDSDISSVIETRDGGYLAGGSFRSSTIDLGNGVVLNNKGSHEGMVIKYDAEGKAEWAKGIGGSSADYIQSVIETRDGGYLAGGRFSSSTIDLGNGVVLKNSGNTSGMLIKYDTEGKAEWARGIGGSSDVKITAVIETRDGGYLAGGHFNSSTIDLGNGVVLKNNGSTAYSDGMVIKLDSRGEVEWAKGIGGGYSEEIKTVIEMRDGGYLAGGRFSSSTIDLENGVVLKNNANNRTNDGMVIKYDAKGKVEWAKGIGGGFNDSINSVIETKDGGYLAGGDFQSNIIDLGNGMLIKYDAEGEVEWEKGIGGSDYDYINSAIETSDGGYLAGGYFQSSTIDLGNGAVLNNKGSSDGMLIKIAEEMGVPEVQEITATNTRKEFKITTDVKEIDNIKGGSISGEDYVPYEKVKYGDNNTKEILMTPDENYEIISVTVNGEEYQFKTNEDGTYTMPIFEDITEDKHIEVTYSYKDNKITINKIDSITKEKLIDAKFKLDQIEERTIPENIIGDLTDNGIIYDNIDTENQETIDGVLTSNGAEIVIPDKSNEILDAKGNLTNNGTYYFIEQAGKYVPTNSKTYQTANGGTYGKNNTTANSYITIDLTGKEGKYVVVVNAEIISESSDYGYATITETTTAPSYSSATGRFIYISGTKTAKEYTSMALEGGKTYYLHLGYRKDGSVDTGADQIVINNINVYGAEVTSYNFEETDGKYIPNNLSNTNTTANSYIPIDLTGKEGKYAIVVNAETNYTGGSGYLYATLNENTTAPSYSTTTGRFVYLTSTQSAKDYVTYVDGGKQYYLHLGYTNTSGTPTNISINSVSLYKDKQVTYNFVENEGKYESNNQGMNSTVANSYIPIDLRGYTGKYNLTVNAEVSSQSNNDYGYATITENTTRPAYNTSTGRLIYISGTVEAKDYTTVLEGGKLYYLHLGYYKNASTSSGNDKFTINSVNVTLNDSELYHTEVETNSEGQAITQIPFGKYYLTEVEVPEGYEKLKKPVIIEFRADAKNVLENPNTENVTVSDIGEFVVENTRKSKVTVYHYLKDRAGNITDVKVEKDESFEGIPGEEYKTVPHLDLEKYELEKDESGEYIIPENAIGKFAKEDIEVKYYYVEKKIPLTVHHYIEGTEEKVPLIDETEAEDIVTSGYEGETYETQAIANEELSSKYELSKVPENSNGTYAEDEIIVTYYYKKVERKVSLTKYQEDGITSLSGAKFIIAGKEYITDENGKIKLTLEAGKYEVIEIEAPEGYELPEVTTTEVEITRETEEENINIINEKIKGTVTVHHYIKGTEEKVPLKDGTRAEDEIKTDYIGNMYATKALENILEGYRYAEVEGEASGNYIDGNIEVTYYYEKRDDIDYKVEYYYDNIKDETKTENLKGTFEEEITTYPDKNIVGYKLEKTEGMPLIISATEENIIKVYYVKDEFNYTVEYYYDNVKDDSKTETAKATYQDVIEDYIDKNITGYKLEKTENLPLTISEKAEENIIKVYYVKDEFNYTVEYYYDNVKDDNKTETGKAIYQDVIEDYIDKNITGYKLEKTENLPLTISEKSEENIIKVYYVKDEFNYTVEYYYDNVKDDSKTETAKATYQDLIEDYIDKNITGYKLEKTENLPLTISEKSEENIIKVYYVKDEFNYTVEYYYDNVKDDSKTETAKATYQDVIENYIDKNITGYKLEKTENLPLTISEKAEENIIKVYYIKDEFNYTVEYYYDNVKDDIKTETAKATYQEVIEDYIDKNILGYKLEKTENLPLTISEKLEENIIKVYYVKDEFNYTVEYYYDNVKDDSKTETAKATYQDVIENYIDKNITGYKLEKTENLPLTISEKSEENIIKVYYVKDEFNYTVEYYYDNVKDDSKTETNKATYQDVVENYVDKNITGYKLEKTENLPLTISEKSEENIIKVYYVKDEFNYTVEYYYDNVKDDSKTETNKATYQDVVENYVDKNITGYKLEKTENLPLTISEKSEENIIKVYYVKDEFNYTVEYYYDNVKDDSKTETSKATYLEVIEDYMDKNIVGYKLEKTENLPLTVSENESNNVIKIYYIIDDGNTKDLSYTVEYYKEGTKVEEDTQIVKETVQVLEPDTLTVDKTSINTTDKYFGYKLEKTEPSSIPDTVNNEDVIKVYYVKDEFDYTVEYYYDKVKDDSKTETSKATYQEVIEDYIDKNITGYKLEKTENLPLTISEKTEENIIKVYYVKDEFNYTVEYYYDNVKDDSKTETAKATYQEVIKDYIDKNITGYKLEKTENLPLTVSENESNNVIKIYYIIDDGNTKELSYTVEYYKDGTKVEEDTQIVKKTVQILEPDTLTVDKTSINLVDKYFGYKLEKTEPSSIPDTVNNGDVIKVYYVKDEFNYIVEYYYDNVKDDSKTETAKATYQEVIEDYIDKNITGYKLEKTENLPLTISEKSEENIIKVYYVKDEFNYTVEYYYDNVKDDSKTEIAKATYQEVIEDYIDKNIIGYKLEKTEGLPLVISELSGTNVIRVYYVKDAFNYTVEYYYDEVKDEGKTDNLSATYGEEVTTYTEKLKDGYKFDKVENLPLIVTENLENNVIKVYYTRKDAIVTVKYLDKATEQEISNETIKTGKVFDKYDVTEDEKEVEGYTLIERPNPTTGEFTEENQIKIYYYARNTEVVVRYVEKDTNLELLESKTIAGYEGKEYSTTKEEIENYTFVESTENTEGIMTIEPIEVIYYYAQNTKATVNYIDRETDEILYTETEEGKVGDIFETEAKDFEGYVLVEEPVQKVVTMTKEEIVLNYYYAHISSGVIEKHIDVMTGEILDNKTYMGNEGDVYKTTSKTFEGYDLVEERLPENAEGIMTIEVIEVKYYYIRQAEVIVNYIDVITGKHLEEIERKEVEDQDGNIKVEETLKDSTEVILGHEGDNYTTTEKAFEGYIIVKEKYPTNSEGIMKVSIDDAGKVNTTIIVDYYYVHISGGVIENHIDVKTNEIIETKIYEGNEGDPYKTEEKVFEGYDLVKEQYPINSEGYMTIDKVEVNYYYIRKAKVVVEYIDKNTGETLKELDKQTGAEKDSTEIIIGHEGDMYTTKEKAFDNYVIVKEEYPENAQGEMTVIRKADGTVENITYVRYYYVYEKATVVEKHIDAITGEVLDLGTTYEGNEGDPYATKPKEIEGYDIVEEKLPGNSEGTMSKEEIEVRYYYIKKTKVIVEYIDKKTGNKLTEDVVINGHEGDNYMSENKNFEGYDFVEKTDNANGKMTREDIVVKYYYDKKPEEIVIKVPENPQPENTEKPSKPADNNNNKPINTPSTGDMLPVIAVSIIGIIILANVVQIILNKKKNN